MIFSQADSGTDPDAIRPWACAAEDAGFEHLMAYDHVLGASPDGSARVRSAASRTAVHGSAHVSRDPRAVRPPHHSSPTRMHFVTSVLVLPNAKRRSWSPSRSRRSSTRERDVSGSPWCRMERAEYEALGVDFADRIDVAEEQIDATRTLWTEPEVEYHGQFHDLEGVGINPRPPGLIPIYMGSGASDGALRRVVRKADGWMPLLLPGRDPIDLRTGVTRLRQIAVEEGRDPERFRSTGRVYLGEGWQKEVDEALELGFSHLSVGFNRMANPGLAHAQHLDVVLDVKPEVDRLVG